MFAGDRGLNCTVRALHTPVNHSGQSWRMPLQTEGFAVEQRLGDLLHVRDSAHGQLVRELVKLETSATGEDLDAKIDKTPQVLEVL